MSFARRRRRGTFALRCQQQADAMRRLVGAAHRQSAGQLGERVSGEPVARYTLVRQSFVHRLRSRGVRAHVCTLTARNE